METNFAKIVSDNEAFLKSLEPAEKQQKRAEEIIDFVQNLKAENARLKLQVKRLKKKIQNMKS